MDSRRFSAIAHGDLSVWNPLDERDLAEAIALLPAGGQDVLDVGCGRAQVLAMVLGALPGARGVGVDPSPYAIAAARSNLRSLLDRVTLVQAPFEPGAERFDVILCIGAVHAVGTLDDALRVLGGILRPGGRLLLGAGYWRRTPDPAYLSFLGAREDDHCTHEGNIHAAHKSGWSAVLALETSQVAWDRYESAYAANVHAHVSAHPDDPDAAAMLERIDAWRDAYHLWGRATLGFGLYVLARSAD